MKDSDGEIGEWKVFSCQEESVWSPMFLSVIPLDVSNKMGHFAAVSEEIKPVALSHKNEIVALLRRAGRLASGRSLSETTSKYLLA